MQRYILSRFIQAIIATFAVVTIVFLLARLTGDPVTLIAGQRATPELRAQISKDLGLDKPVIIQYFKYIIGICKGDFGYSFKYKRSALSLVIERMPATLELMGVSLLLSIIFSVPIGVYSATKKGSFIDIVGRGFAFLGMSAPPFLVALMLMYLFAVHLQVLPVGGRGGPEHWILPAVTLAFLLSAGIVRITRSSMLDVLDSDYITLAKIKGVSDGMITWKHAFKNAAIPVVTFIMIMMILLVSGEVIIENIFAWPGIGRLIMGAVVSRDFPVVQTATILISFSFIMINLVADILYAYLNPKIHY